MFCNHNLRLRFPASVGVVSEPPEYWFGPPADVLILWHGMMIGIGLRRHACPAGRAALGFPQAFANSPYDQRSP